MNPQPSAEKDAGLVALLTTHLWVGNMTPRATCDCNWLAPSTTTCGVGIQVAREYAAHVAAALTAAGVGVIADAREYAAKCAAETVRILDREVDLRAEAWDEGYDARGRDIANEGLTVITVTPNPYRGGSDA